MTDILNEITAHKRAEVERFKKILTEKDIHRQVEDMILGETVPTASMSKAIMEGSGIIAEFKRRSPSNGWLKEDGRPDIVPLGYQKYGASAISILTDSRFFGGQDMDITTARHSGVVIPILYKNFVIDEYQLFQARLCGASAVLLIAPASQRSITAVCLPRHTPCTWRCCWKCTQRQNWSMQKTCRTCAASTTVISVHSSPTCTTRSAWQTSCRMMQ